MKKITVGILFGGKSAEHEVSLQSAKNVYDAIDRGRYEPVLIGIDKTGRWLLNDASRFLLNPEDPKNISLNPRGEKVALAPQSEGVLSSLGPASGGASGIGALNSRPMSFKLDVVFPILHGPFGEDGTVQGLLKLADIPFVGSGVLGSAAGMDKDVMKRLLRDAGIPIGKFLVIRSETGEALYGETSSEDGETPDEAALPGYADVIKTLGLPFFVKPANMGSSVGVNKVHNESEYSAAVNDAFLYDNKVILEEFIPGRELECAVLGPAVSVPGEVISSHEFYSYDAKYLDENGAALEIPANIPAQTAKRVRELAAQSFKVLCCEGLSRVDFFLRENGDVLVNEINTMPGFTRISMYPKLWEASGISYTELISRLIDLAFDRFEKERKLKTSVL